MRAFRLIGFVATVSGAVALGVGASSGGAGPPPGPTGHAWAIKVIVPDQPPVSSRVLDAPPDAVSYDGAFAYPSDGSIVAVGSVTTSVSAVTGVQATADATAQVTALSLFKGEITAASVSGESHAIATSASASGDVGVTSVTGLVVLGQATVPTPGQQIPLADWGTLVALGKKSSSAGPPAPAFDGVVTALDVFVTAAHGGLPAGSEIQIGYAEADAQGAEPPPATTTAPATQPTPHKPRKKKGPFVSKPLHVKPPELGGGEHVFPIYGEASYGDTYGADRGDVSGDWHHGDDIFAALGTPVLAAGHGTVFSVGWNKVGGWRLWLRDDAGNEFYYAHLSAYSPFAVDGAIVNAGDVLGFVGNTGDAEGTPYHLHFEVHPVGYLGLGYDGAIDPTTYLHDWTRLVSIRFDAAAGWVPAQSAAAPRAGAILLQSSDISTASGLDPASLDRAFVPTSNAGEGGLPLPQPPASKPVAGG